MILRNIAIILVLFCVALISGCQALASLGTPTSYEQKISAEFDLSKYETEKILIFVKPLSDSENEKKVAFYLDTGIKARLVTEKVVKQEQFIPYSELSKYKNDNFLFDIKQPTEVANDLGANVVLVVEIDDFKLDDLDGTNFYEGSMTASASLVDVNNSQVLWPGEGSNKVVKVGFDVENAGVEASCKRLSLSSAHCITRYLYDCPKASFKIFEETAQSGW